MLPFSVIVYDTKMERQISNISPAVSSTQHMDFKVFIYHDMQ